MPANPSAGAIGGWEDPKVGVWTYTPKDRRVSQKYASAIGQTLL